MCARWQYSDLLQLENLEPDKGKRQQLAEEMLAEKNFECKDHTSEAMRKKGVKIWNVVEAVIGEQTSTRGTKWRLENKAELSRTQASVALGDAPPPVKVKIENPAFQDLQARIRVLKSGDSKVAKLLQDFNIVMARLTAAGQAEAAEKLQKQKLKISEAAMLCTNVLAAAELLKRKDEADVLSAKQMEVDKSVTVCIHLADACATALKEARQNL